MAPTPESALMNTAEVARLLRVHPKHVYRLLRRGMPGRRLGGEWRFVSADVLAWMNSQGSRVTPMAPTAPTTTDATERSPLDHVSPLIAANGDLVIEVLIDQVNVAGPPLLGFVASDRAHSLSLLERRAVIAAGCHGDLPPTRFGSTRLARIQLVEREVGLVFTTTAPPKLTQLGRLRVAVRPPTAGVYVHLRHALEVAGVDARKALARSAAYGSHRDVVCAVRRGEADVGLATQAWAARVGLQFAHLATESYGLLVRGIDLGEPLVVRVCEVAQSAAFRKAMRAIAGYDPKGAGEIRYDPESSGCVR